ncbi:hypothetical protein Hsw_0353 [Hymenobacter swuensis DY53]|uniref:Uncharacterized protein n=1 Tax=Hymenobacter swuensis DY53 TaxID=1227739 RepID=W8ETY2_9BACT|nr:hypothetical protein Hsw_0353 [Hymenobacter swuensis DY53]
MKQQDQIRKAQKKPKNGWVYASQPFFDFRKTNSEKSM